MCIHLNCNFVKTHVFLRFLKAGMTHAYGNVGGNMGRRLDDSKSLNELKFQVNEILYQRYWNAFDVQYFPTSSFILFGGDLTSSHFDYVDWRLFGCGSSIEEDGFCCISSDGFSGNISDGLSRK